jgi:hypothetical protein
MPTAAGHAGGSVALARQAVNIDRDKLREAIRRLGAEHVFYMLDDAIDLLPPAKLHKIVRKYLDVKRLRQDGEKTAKASPCAAVKAFDKASRAGDYYESFGVNSKNFMEKSQGTTAWIAECHRLLHRCVDEAKRGDQAEVRQAFDIIFGLLDRIDECRDDIIFFADEAGAWQVGVDWEKVLPPWFKVLSATAGPEEYARKVVSHLKHHYHYGSARMLTVARKTATEAQRQALASFEQTARVTRSTR